MVPRPYEANLLSQDSIVDFSKFTKKDHDFLFLTGRDRIASGRGSSTRAQEGQERAKEGQTRAI